MQSDGNKEEEDGTSEKRKYAWIELEFEFIWGVSHLTV